MNKLKSKLVKKLKGKTVNHDIRICIDCGSTIILIDEKKLRCKECGTVRRINK